MLTHGPILQSVSRTGCLIPTATSGLHSFPSAHPFSVVIPNRLLVCDFLWFIPYSMVNWKFHGPNSEVHPFPCFILSWFHPFCGSFLIPWFIPFYGSPSKFCGSSCHLYLLEGLAAKLTLCRLSVFVSNRQLPTPFLRLQRGRC